VSVLHGKQGKGKALSQAKGCSGNLVSSGFRGISSPAGRLRYSTDHLTTVPLLRNILLLQVENGLLTEIHEKLPLGRHVAGTVKQIHMIENIVPQRLVRS